MLVCIFHFLTWYCRLLQLNVNILYLKPCFLQKILDYCGQMALDLSQLWSLLSLCLKTSKDRDFSISHGISAASRLINFENHLSSSWINLSQSYNSSLRIMKNKPSSAFSQLVIHLRQLSFPPRLFFLRLNMPISFEPCSRNLVWHSFSSRPDSFLWVCRLNGQT